MARPSRCIVRIRGFSSWASTLESASLDTALCFSPSRDIPAFANSLLTLPSEAVHWACASNALVHRTNVYDEASVLSISHRLLVLRAFEHMRSDQMEGIVAQTCRKLALNLVTEDLPLALQDLQTEEVEQLYNVPLQHFQRHVATELLRRYESDNYLSPLLYHLRSRLQRGASDKLDQAIEKIAREGDKDMIALATKYTLRYLDHKPLMPLGPLRFKLWEAPNILSSWAEYCQTPNSSDSEFVLRVGLQQSTPLELVQAAVVAPSKWTELINAKLLEAWPEVSAALKSFPVSALPHVVMKYWNIEKCRTTVLSALAARMPEMRLMTLLQCIEPLEGPQPEFDTAIQEFFATPPADMDLVKSELDVDIHRSFSLVLSFAERGFAKDHWLLNHVFARVEEEFSTAQDLEFGPSMLMAACRHLEHLEGRPLLLKHILDVVSKRRWKVEDVSSASLTTALSSLGMCHSSICPRQILDKALKLIVHQMKRGERELGSMDLERLCAIDFQDYATQSMPMIFPLLVNANPPPISQFSSSGIVTLLERLREWSANGGMYEDDHQHVANTSPRVGVQRAIDLALDKYKWTFPQLCSIFKSLAQLGWCERHTVTHLCQQAMRIDEKPHVPIESMLSIVESFAAMRVFHAPLLERFVKWYTWYVGCVREHDLTSEEVDAMATFALQLAKFNFRSLEFAKTIAMQLDKSTTPSQKLRLLTQLARFGYFPPEFRQGLIALVEASKARAHPLDPDAFADIKAEEWADAYFLHLCTYFDGPERLRSWILSDPDFVHFIKGDPAHYWFERKRLEGRSQFKPLLASRQIKRYLASLLGENFLVPGIDDENFIYYVNFIDPREPTDDFKPLAVVFVHDRHELKICVPLVGLPPRHEMFDDMVHKVRHLRFMRYRVVVIFDSEWSSLADQGRTRHLKELLKKAGAEIKDEISDELPGKGGFEIKGISDDSDLEGTK